MELTDENQDYMDCRPINPNNSIKVTNPDWMDKLIAERKAKQALKNPYPTRSRKASLPA